jgi:hypothetical protein
MRAIRACAGELLPGEWKLVKPKVDWPPDRQEHLRKVHPPEMPIRVTSHNLVQLFVGQCERRAAEQTRAP